MRRHDEWVLGLVTSRLMIMPMSDTVPEEGQYIMMMMNRLRMMDRYSNQ